MALSQWTPESFAVEAAACLKTRQQSRSDIRLTSLLQHVQDQMLATTALDVEIDSAKEPDLEWILKEFRHWISPIASIYIKRYSLGWQVRVALCRIHLEPEVLDALDPALVEFWMITRGQWKARRLGDILKAMQLERTSRVSIKVESYHWAEIPWVQFILVPFLESAGFQAWVATDALVCVSKK